ELDLPHEDRVRRLLGPEAGRPDAFGDPRSFLELPAGEGRGAEVSDLPRTLQIGEDTQRLVDLRLRFGAMDLVEVDVVGAEAAQRALHLARDPQPRVALLALPHAHPAVDLPPQHDLVASSRERCCAAPI